MKILVLTDLFPTLQNPNHGIFIYQWAFHLAKMCDMTVYQVIFQEKDKPIDKVMTDRFREIYPQSQPFVWIQRPKTISRFDRIWRRSRQFYKQAENDLAESIGEFDIIIGQMGCPGGYAAVKLARKYGKPSIVGLRGSDVTSYLKIPILKRQAKWTYLHCDRIVTVSEDLKKQLSYLKINSKKVSVIRNGINPIFQITDKALSRKKLNLPDKPIILFVGYLIPPKGVKYLINAILKMKRHPDCQLYLIGEGDEEANLKKLTVERDTSDRVYFIGEVNQSDMVTWYNATDLFCLPSLREGIPNVMLEALACGIPVVTTDIGDNSKIINENNGVLILPEDANLLVKAIEKTLSQKWNREVIHQSVAGFNWEKNSNTYFETISRTIEAHLK
ncbi:MAG: hypothetical protein COT43_11370 [Candidatus Marinimicrobia bacterium CG08_land_8_20_14_0_20_45_22]|nr:MAG: hypothetical protein COT43_11370 [Candidatus Marinimicrobia bacterium CG08_land_8_20_14_0_20_45_22]